MKTIEENEIAGWQKWFRLNDKRNNEIRRRTLWLQTSVNVRNDMHFIHTHPSAFDFGCLGACQRLSVSLHFIYTL